MAWQAYVDTSLCGSGKISKAAIIGLDGSIWATSPDFTVSSEEQKALLDGFNGHMKLFQTGIQANGKKYTTLQADDRSIYGKHGTDTFVAVKTKQTFLVGICLAPVPIGQVADVVEKLADYLIGNGY